MAAWRGCLMRRASSEPNSTAWPISFRSASRLRSCSTLGPCMGAAISAGWARLPFSICAARRLARFNTALSTLGPRQPKAPYFVGVPTPAGAALSLLPLLVDLEVERPILANHPYLVSLWVLGVAL